MENQRLLGVLIEKVIELNGTQSKVLSAINSLSKEPINDIKGLASKQYEELCEIRNQTNLVIDSIKNMDSSQYEVLTVIQNLNEQVINQIKELNHTQQDALSAMNDLSDQLKSSLALDITSFKMASSINANTDQASPRTYGYINWNSNHEILKTKLWGSMEDIANYLGVVERRRCGPYDFFMKNKKVDEKTRFPKNDLYVNVNNPLVSVEILYIMQKAGLGQPLPGILDRFIDAAKCEMHTYSSFEEKYGLRWIEAKKN